MIAPTLTCESIDLWHKIMLSLNQSHFEVILFKHDQTPNVN